MPSSSLLSKSVRCHVYVISWPTARASLLVISWLQWDITLRRAIALGYVNVTYSDGEPYLLALSVCCIGYCTHSTTKTCHGFVVRANGVWTLQHNASSSKFYLYSSGKAESEVLHLPTHCINDFELTLQLIFFLQFCYIRLYILSGQLFVRQWGRGGGGISMAFSGTFFFHLSPKKSEVENTNVHRVLYKQSLPLFIFATLWPIFELISLMIQFCCTNLQFNQVYNSTESERRLYLSPSLATPLVTLSTQKQRERNADRQSSHCWLV